MKKYLLVSSVLAVGLLASCGGGGGGSSSPSSGTSGGSSGGSSQYVNVSGSVTTQPVSSQSLQVMAANCPTIKGQTPDSIVAVSVDSNGNIVAVGSKLSQNCSFNLKLNKDLTYAFAIFDTSGLPITAILPSPNGTGFKFLGDVNITVVAKDTNNDGQPDKVDVSVDNPQNIKEVSDPNLLKPISEYQRYDRDGNRKPDYIEDKDGNGTPDWWEDRNNNQIPDAMEDWDHNGVPEGLEDENRDGIPDHMEDRDHNGHPEYHDCNGNGRWDDEEHEGEEG
ncbi:MAG: hypothetical protein DSY32_01995, partial [Aquifex sp.]